MIIVSLLSLFVASQDILTLENEIQDIKQLIEENYLILSNSVKKSQDLGRDSRLIISKSSQAMSRLQQSTDVNIYSLFNSEIQKKHPLMESKLKNSERLLADQVFTKKIKITLDYFSHKQKTTAAYQVDFADLERAMKKLRETIDRSSDFSTIYLFLLFLSLGVVLLWKNVKIAEKRHFL